MDKDRFSDGVFFKWLNMIIKVEQGNFKLI